MIVRGKVSRSSNARGIRVVPRSFPSLFQGRIFYFCGTVKSTFHRLWSRYQDPFEKDTGFDTRAHLKRTEC